MKRSSSPEPQATLKSLKLLTGRGKFRSLISACHAGRLKGGLSISLNALPDEVIGSLAHLMGGAATELRVLDVRTGRPMVMEVSWRTLTEKWELESLESLIHNLNDLLKTEASVKFGVVLGEWEDMLQVLFVSREQLPTLIDRRIVDDANNLVQLRRIVSPAEPTDVWDL